VPKVPVVPLLIVNLSLSSSRIVRRSTGVRLVALAVVLAAALTLGLVALSSADTVGDKKKLDAGIAQLNAELEDTSQNLAHAFVELQRTKAELPGARLALTAADAALGVADRNNEMVATALAVAQANAAKASDALAQNARDSQQVQDQVGNLAVDDYEQGGISVLSVALQASSPEDFTNRLIMMDTVMGVREGTLRALDTMVAEGQAVRAHLVAVRQQVAALKVQSEAALVQASAARQTVAAANTTLDLLFAAQTRYAATVAAKKVTEIKNIDKMQAQSDALTRVLAARARAAREAAAGAGNRIGPGSGSGSGLLSYPVNGPESSPFGPRFDPIMQVWRLHAGIDFAVDCGSPVYAAAAGEVILTTPTSQSGGYGNRLVIDHGFQRGVDLTTTYNHLSSFVVTAGHVDRGQLVAYSGTTGFSTGCHLHFETRENGVPVDPRLWL
jgi:murein DD-endopeptidase MepM/ murein hydrolase activator NlpD